MNLKEIFQRRKPDEGDLRGELMTKARMLSFSLPQVDCYTGSVSIDRKIAPLELSNLPCVNGLGCLKLEFQMIKPEEVVVSIGTRESTLCVHATREKIIITSSNGLPNREWKKDGWSLFKNMIEIGESEIEQQERKSDGRASSS